MGQVHDLNGGIPPSGLFWTVELPRHSFWMSKNRTRAVLYARNVPLVDTFSFGGFNNEPFGTCVNIPSIANLYARWDATGPRESLGAGDSVPATDPAAFLGKFSRARAVGRFSGKELGFSFKSKGRATSDLGYAALGKERNGVFL